MSEQDIGNTSFIGKSFAVIIGLILLLFIAEGVLRMAMPHWKEFYNGRFMRLIEVPNYGIVATGLPGFNDYFSQNNRETFSLFHSLKFGSYIH